MPTNKGIVSLNDRKEGYGHVAGSTLKDDADWAVGPSTPAVHTDTTSARLAFLVAATNATSREYGAPTQAPDLFDRSSEYGHTNGSPADGSGVDVTANSEALALTGSNSALTTSSTEASATVRTADVPTATERQHASIQDRTSGFGHTAGSVAALHD